MARARRQRRTRGEIAAWIAGGLLALAYPVWLFGGAFYKHQGEAVELAREWQIDGPPCPQLTAAEFAARGLKAPQGLDYNGAVFYRQFGHLECSSIGYHGGRSLFTYAECQFTGPNSIRVVTPKGEWYFAPGIGRPATVVTPHGQARCVMASNFRL